MKTSHVRLFSMLLLGGLGLWPLPSKALEGQVSREQDIVNLQLGQRVKVDDGTLTVSMDGNLLLTQTVNLGPKVLIGFSGGTGSLTDTHAVSGTSILTT